MKLYAKTRSERAEKGQGGNEFIEVKLTVQIAQSTHEIGILRLIPQGDDYVLALDRSSFGRDPKESCRVYEEFITLKGEKKKGDN